MSQSTAYSLKLTANASGLTSGLDKAKTDVANKLGGIEKAASGKVAGIGAALGPGGVVATALTTGIGAAVGFVSSAIADAYKSFGKFGQISKAAGTLGVGVEQYQGLSMVLAKAGVEGEQVGTVLGKLGAKIQQAKVPGSEMAKVFDSLGLSASDLAKMPLDEQFKAISTAIAKLPPGGEQAAAALKLFEEAGVKLLPALQKGGAGIQEFIDRQKALGTIFSAEEVGMASRAKKAWGEATNTLDAVWQSVKQRALIALAPIIETGGKIFNKIIEKGMPVFGWIQRVFASLNGVVVPFFEDVTEYALKLVDQVAGWVSGLGMFEDKFYTVENVVPPILNGLAVGFAYMWDVVKAGAGAMSNTFGVAIEGLGDMTIAFQESLKTLVRTAKSVSFLFGPIGSFALSKIDPNKIGQAGAAIKQLGMDWQKWGRDQIEAFGGSAQAVDEWFKRLEQRKKNEPDFSGADIPEAWNASMNGGNQSFTYQATAALEAGSQAALSAINRFMYSTDGDDTAQKQLEQQRETKEYTKRTFEHISRNEWGLM